MKKQFITAVILAALLATGCEAMTGDTAVTSAQIQEAAEETVASSSNEEEAESDEAESAEEEKITKASASESEKATAETSVKETEKTREEETEEEAGTEETEEEDEAGKTEEETEEDAEEEDIKSSGSRPRPFSVRPGSSDEKEKADSDEKEKADSDEKEKAEDEEEAEAEEDTEEAGSAKSDMKDSFMARRGRERTGKDKAGETIEAEEETAEEESVEEAAEEETVGEEAAEEGTAEEETAGEETAEEESAEEEEFEASDGLVFKSNRDGTSIITDIGTCTDSVLVIPDKSPRGDTVTAIAEGAFDHAEGIETVVFTNITAEIETSAFADSSVENLIVSDSTLTIDEDAFSYCDRLSYFCVSDSNVITDRYAFDSACEGADLIFANSVLLFDDESFVYSGVRSIMAEECTIIIGEDAFDYCEDIETIEFSDCLVNIGPYAFFCAGSQMEMLIEDCDVVMEENAFAFSDLINLEINGSTVQIGEDAFDYCEALENIIVRASVINTDPYAFYGCGDQAKVVFENGEVTLGKGAFAFADIVSLKIIKCEVDIGQEAFKSCVDLERVDISSGNITIGRRAFYHCTALREVSLADNGSGPHSIVIGEDAFEFSGLEKVMLGKGSTEIGRGAFEYCEDLKDVKIRGELISLGRNAFFRCSDDLTIHYDGEEYSSKTIQDAVTVSGEGPQNSPQKPDLRKDPRPRSQRKASFDASTFGDTYYLGETWNVPGQWTMTIDSVYLSDERSEASDNEPEAVYIVDYTYENTGFKGANGASEGLYMSLGSSEIRDAEGTAAYIYPGSLSAVPIRLAKGESCSAQARIGVDHAGTFTVTVSLTDGNRESQEATFVIDADSVLTEAREEDADGQADDAEQTDAA